MFEKLQKNTYTSLGYKWHCVLIYEINMAQKEQIDQKIGIESVKLQAYENEE